MIHKNLTEPGAKKVPAKQGVAVTPAASRRRASGDDAQVLTYRHGDRRKDNPEVSMVDPRGFGSA